MDALVKIFFFIFLFFFAAYAMLGFAGNIFRWLNSGICWWGEFLGVAQCL